MNRKSIKENPTLNIVSQMGKFYSSFPYPHYPLFAKPRWQDAYLNSYHFCETLLHQSHFGRSRDFGKVSNPSTLLMGSGEILPYLCSKWESKDSPIFAIDISSRSLRRSRLRTCLLKNDVRYIHQDIHEFLSDKKRQSMQFDYIQSFGVLHHLGDPTTTIKLLSTHLHSNSILRVMVYNSQGRDFIHRIQDLLKLLNLTPFSDTDFRFAKNLVKSLGACSPRYAERLRCMGSTILENNTRFADAFFNPLELRTPVTDWIQNFEKYGLQVFALFDRYGELDDLKNPLLLPPTVTQLNDRAADRRYEGNLEIFLTPKENDLGANLQDKVVRPAVIPRSLRWKSPPNQWFDFPETKKVSKTLQKEIWHQFLGHIANDQTGIHAETVEKLDTKVLQRLSRIGAVFPSQFRSMEIREQLLQPMSTHVEPLPNPSIGKFSCRELLAEMTRLNSHDRKNLDKLEGVLSNKVSFDNLKAIS